LRKIIRHTDCYFEVTLCISCVDERTITPNIDMPTLDRWPFPQDPVPRSWVAASRVTIAAVGIFAKLCAGWWYRHRKEFFIRSCVFITIYWLHLHLDKIIV